MNEVAKALQDLSLNLRNEPSWLPLVKEDRVARFLAEWLPTGPAPVTKRARAETVARAFKATKGSHKLAAARREPEFRVIGDQGLYDWTVELHEHHKRVGRHLTNMEGVLHLRLMLVGVWERYYVALVKEPQYFATHLEASLGMHDRIDDQPEGTIRSEILDLIRRGDGHFAIARYTAALRHMHEHGDLARTRQLLGIEEGYDEDTRLGKTEVRFIHTKRKILRSFYYDVTALEADWACINDRNASGFNVYVGVGLRKQGARRGAKDDVLSMPAAFIDYDVQGQIHEEDHDVLMDRLRSRIGLDSSLVVATGHGFHLYWRLKEPFFLTQHGRAAYFESILSRLAMVAGSDPAVADVARVMRVPGTMNVKNPNQHLPACLIRCAPDLQYSLREIEKVLPPPDSAPAPCSRASKALPFGEIPRQLPAKFGELVEAKAGLRCIWEGRIHTEASRSERDAALAASLLSHGLTPEEVCCVLVHFPHGRGREATPRYLVLTVSSAARFVGRAELLEANVGRQKGERTMAWKPKQEMEELNVTAGWRKAVITQAWDSESRSGNQMTTVQFETRDEEQRETAFDHFVHDHPVATRRMLGLLKAVGLADREEVETDELIGRELLIKLAVEDFDGLPQARVRRFKALDESPRKDSGQRSRKSDAN